MDVTILIPTLNECESISQMIREIRDVIPEADIVVIDGLSTDGTSDIARQEGADVWLCDKKGKGAAMRFAFSKCESDYAVMLDGDGTYEPNAIVRLLAEMERYDVIQGRRVEVGDAIAPLNRIGNRILTLLSDLLYGMPVLDVCSGMWCMKKTFYKKITITEDGFGLEANLFTEAAIGRFYYSGRYPVYYKPRKGKSKLRFWHGLEIAWFLIKKAV